jgi:uncharacterized membrane protein YecN with MAPEG domain
MTVYFVCAGLLGLLAALLTLNVGRLRTSKRIFLGDGGDKEMTAAIRAHGNLIELTPLCLLLIWLLGASYGDKSVATMAMVLLVARLAHAGGILGFIPLGRTNGAVATTVLLTVVSNQLALSGLKITLY